MVVLVIRCPYQQWQTLTLQFFAHIGDTISERSARILRPLSREGDIEDFRVYIVLFEGLVVLSPKLLEHLPEYRVFAFIVYLPRVHKVECLASPYCDPAFRGGRQLIYQFLYHFILEMGYHLLLNHLEQVLPPVLSLQF